MTPTESAARLAELTGVDRHDAAVVLGSGWKAAAEALGSADAEIALTDLGLPGPSAHGHGGTVRSVRMATSGGELRVLVFLGRVHAYEGHDLALVVHGVRTAVAAGCSTVVLTNAAGGLNPAYELGQLVLVSDHLNLTGRSPLVGPRFVDLGDLYSARLRAIAREVDPTLAEGVYAGVPGPHFETPAEIRMIRMLGADVVGMSTVHEAIAAHAEGASVLGLSLVTNAAAGCDGHPEHAHGEGGTPIDHLDVLAVGEAAAPRAGKLIADVLTRL
ncbi:MAG: purine-nucleoside phosphorylase [Frankiaceae bacterium]|nr:purine-nucleoside phosphorylase [Frankiaceae bacterium]